MSNFADEQAMADWHAERPGTEHDWTDEDVSEFEAWLAPASTGPDPWGDVQVVSRFPYEDISDEPPF